LLTFCIGRLLAQDGGLETESRLGLHGHERGNPGCRQDIDLTDHRASPRPYQVLCSGGWHSHPIWENEIEEEKTQQFRRAHIEDTQVRGYPCATMILSHAHKFIFLCNGRTGTTSIEHALWRYDESGGLASHEPGLWVDKHIPRTALRSLLPAEQWDSYFKFVFVRHPLDWFVSQYRYNLERPPSLSRVLAKPRKAPAALRAFHRARARREERVYDVADVERLHRYLRRNRGLPDTPTLFQSSYVDDTDGTQIVDFVGRFELLAADIARVQQRIGIDFALPHLNRTDHPDGRAYRNSLTEAGVRKVRELWAVDFDRLGYEAITASSPDYS